MCLCASLSRRRRGPAGLRDPFSSVEIVACMPCAQGLSACARHGRYHYPRRALRAAETPDGRLSKRLTCRFLRSGEQRSLRSAYFFRIYRIFCRQFQLRTLLRYGTINPRNWKNFRTIMPLNSRLQLQVPHRGHAPNNRKEVLSHEETHLFGSGGPPAAEPCRLRGKAPFPIHQVPPAILHLQPIPPSRMPSPPSPRRQRSELSMGMMQISSPPSRRTKATSWCNWEQMIPAPAWTGSTVRAVSAAGCCGWIRPCFGARSSPRRPSGSWLIRCNKSGERKSTIQTEPAV